MDFFGGTWTTIFLRQKITGVELVVVSMKDEVIFQLVRLGVDARTWEFLKFEDFHQL